MKFRAMRVRIGRLVVERPADEAVVTVAALTEAVRLELAVRLLGQPSMARPPGAAAPLAGAIAGGIAGKLGGGERR